MLNMRNSVAIIGFIVVFALLCYGGVLQDRMLRKARRPGSSIFSIGTVFRAVTTKEFYLFALLALLTIASAATLIAMDKAGYFGPG
jgi:hypothetical protein